ncbi:TIR domain-containing protein [Mucilaginibacter endophyticus]|uniref:TIR domain-containing protein n=1 Tax=Mucilaginibacter endophyticus TaxID=2675003 RepID=UPI001ABFB8B1|nr:TIR domain-containing protein [Mucilaginibacter endophyticus]
METSEIRLLIKNGEIEKAIQASLLLTEGTNLDDVAHTISAKYRKYKLDLIGGILTASEDSIAFATITGNILSVLQEYEKNSISSVRSEKESTGEVFISYAWGGESEIITDAIVNALSERNIAIVRDKTTLGYRSSIKEFMQTIGKGKCVVLVISDRYLKSKNCLFELLQVANNGEFVQRIFPVVLRDANIFNAINFLNYVDYWETQFTELQAAMKKVSIANLHGIREDLDLYSDIRAFLPRLVDKIRDMNTLTVDGHQQSNFNELYEAIIQSINKDIGQHH